MGNTQGQSHRRTIDTKDELSRVIEFGLLNIYSNTTLEKIRKLMKQIKEMKIKTREINISKQTNKEVFDEVFNPSVDFKSLKVLSMIYCCNCDDIELPYSVKNVFNLSVLGSKISRVSFFDNFQSIEVLDIRGCFFDSVDFVNKFTCLKRLNVEAMNLKSLDVSKLVNLETLNFSENLIKKFPDISKNKKLSYVLCFINELDSFPENIPESLRQIDVSKNYIKTLPNFSKVCPELRECSVSYNMIEKVEKETFENLMELSFLNLSGNLIKGTLSVRGSKKLKILNLSLNRIEKLEGLDELLRLEELYLAGNFTFKTFPEGIRSCQRLGKLYLGYNKIEEFPKNLNYTNQYLGFIDVSGNDIKEIPDSVKDLRYLVCIYFGGNKNLKKYPIDLHGQLRYMGFWGNESFSKKEIDEMLLEKQKLKKQPIIPIVEFQDCSNEKFPKLKTSISFSHIKGPFRPTQEDATCVKTIFDDSGMIICGVFDGHGGSQASKVSAREFPNFLRNETDKFVQLNEKKHYNEITHEEWSKIIEISVENVVTKLKSLNCTDGTCMVGCLITEKEIISINIGDSRIIGFNQNTNEIIAMSEDHKPHSEFERLRQNGDIVINSKVNGFVGTARAIGDFQFGLSHKPDVKFFKREGIKWICVGCDGVWDVLKNEDVAEFINVKLQEGESLNEITLGLINYALSCTSRDNISVNTVLFE